MRVAFASKELERICTDERYMQRKLGAKVAKTLKIRIASLTRAQHTDDLLEDIGHWKPLTADRSGQWSARLTGNWRLIIEPDESQCITVTVIAVEDYH
ncbi:type II toxin-antitoxin system RelE/ParE family toxin [Stomatohabitans albus]|uniref:type II toxin-antitoxin system RelE/ParE family toxin n=1 Tax=Stomatohabitans albus TaxID=3110766 RepID=UPI00300D9E41